MFQSIRRTSVKKLSVIEGQTLLSVYIPLEKGVLGHKYNQSQFHNLRSELKKSVTPAQHEAIASELESVLTTLGYTNNSLGFALFYDSKNIWTFALPFSPDKKIEIRTKFDLSPVQDYYKTNKPYYVLAISKKGSKLYEGDMDTLKMLPVDGLGQDVETTLHIDEKHSHDVQNHPVSMGGSNDGVGFHGHGGYKDMKKILFEDYLRFVDKKILSTIKNKKIPLILVAVDYGQSAYKHISKYPSIFKRGVTTNPDDLSPSELHQRTFPLISAI